MSVSLREVSVSSRLASNSRWVCASSTGDTPSSASVTRRRCRSLTPKEAARSATRPFETACSSMPATAAPARRLAASTLASPGARSGRQRRQGLNPAPSAAAALE